MKRWFWISIPFALLAAFGVFSHFIWLPDVLAPRFAVVAALDAPDLRMVVEESWVDWETCYYVKCTVYDASGTELHVLPLADAFKWWNCDFVYDPAGAEVQIIGPFLQDRIWYYGVKTYEYGEIDSNGRRDRRWRFSSEPAGVHP